MIRDKELEPQVYEAEHIRQVLAEIAGNFGCYFSTFAEQPLETVFEEAIASHQKERGKYRDYLALEALNEFLQYDPNAFKSHTRKGGCPIIHRCLMSPDEVMKDYHRSFNRTTGRQLLDTVNNIALFGLDYMADFNDEAHEGTTTYSDLCLEALNEDKYQCAGVIGYGVQSSMLHGLYAREFAHRSQRAVWTLYFLSGRRDFGLRDGSEFLMIRPKEGTCEQNFFYPAELFGFYALKLYLLLKSTCQDLDVSVRNHYRYIYLSRFCDHVAEMHSGDINTYRWSSEHVESQPWF